MYSVNIYQQYRGHEVDGAGGDLGPGVIPYSRREGVLVVFLRVQIGDLVFFRDFLVMG